MASLTGGSLVARVHCRGPEIDAVDLELQRPLKVLSGLRGRPVDECLRLLPMLFSLCGTAHALAALQAVEVAVGHQPEPAHRAARATLALADALAAQVWRTCIDWPQLLGHEIAPTTVSRARRLVERIALAIYPDGDWRRPGGGRLAPDAGALADARTELLDLRAGLDLGGTLAVIRRQLVSALAGTGDQWLTRLEACFVDMADSTEASFTLLDARLGALPALPGTAPSGLSLAAQSGRGQGHVATARGELSYAIDIDSAHVINCSMTAPTDRAFAAEGPVAQLLRHLKRADTPLPAVRWILAGHDPCVDVRVEAVGQG